MLRQRPDPDIAGDLATALKNERLDWFEVIQVVVNDDAVSL